ncbi:MAG: 4-hydroxybenzoyl-CoA reductase [Chloroflexi bacterium]|nr:4-hydroxybenzoyl-CoA reductase [Chloroflexota bacterium]
MTLRLPKFQYVAPRSVREAVATLSEAGPHAMVVAGGTDLYPNMKRRQFTPDMLVGLRGIPELRGVSALPDGGLRIGTGVSLTEVGTHPMVRHPYPALATAAGLVSTPQLRNMGTIGGNICLDTRCNYYDQSEFWRTALGYCMKLQGDVCRVALASPICLAAFSADTVPALIGYDASIGVTGPDGERTIALRDFYRMDGMQWMTLRPSEIVMEVVIPNPDGLRATYSKLRDRGSFDFPIAGVFVGVRSDAGGMVDRAHLVLTGVYSMPMELTSAQDVVLGNKLEPDVIDAAAEAAYAESRPVDNTGGTVVQRRRTIRAFVKRALEALANDVSADAARTA